jgi:AAA15 family ATPase/GTPase
LDAAKNELFYGNSRHNASQKHGGRWSGRPATILLSDYDKLLRALFSEHYEKCTILLKQLKEDRNTPLPETVLEKIQTIWNKILPHRELLIESCKVTVKSKHETALYSASELSDGERAIFYFVGQSLIANENSAIIIDEPELHIHKSILKTLWDEIETARPDCAFVYIT